MPRARQNKGKLDGVEFLHGNPTLTLVRMTSNATRLLEDMGLIPFLQQLTDEADLPLTLQAKRSYNRARCSITITTPQGRLQEIILSSDVVHYALNLPAVGTIVPTTKEMKQMCQPYFTNLIGLNKDGFPLANILDPNIRLVAEAISSHVEISRAERRNQIHARFFCPIHKYLHNKELVHWANLVYEELKKGLKSSQNFIAFAPHLTRIVEWCLVNPGIHLSEAQHIPKSILNPKPLRMIKPSLDFNPGEENINLPAFMNENIRFVDSEQSGVKLQPQTGTANLVDIEGSSRGGKWHEAIQREREERELREREEKEERERKSIEERLLREEREATERRERELKQKADQDVPMRNRSVSPQQGSNEDEDDLSFLDEVIAKVKDDFRRIKRQVPSREVNMLRAQLGVEQAVVLELRRLRAQNEEKIQKLEERIGCMHIQLEHLQAVEQCHVEAIVKAQEEIASLHQINVDREAKIITQAEIIKEFKAILFAKDRELQVAQAQLKSLEQEKKQVEDWKIRYLDVTPTSELANKRELEVRLQEVEDRANLADMTNAIDTQTGPPS